MMSKYGKVKGPYTQKSVRARIEALFLDNIGKILTREQIIESATDPKTGRQPENWHQRLSELRTDYGYTIISQRNRGHLKVSEYLMPTSKKRDVKKRKKISLETWQLVLERAKYRCEWNDAGVACNLRDGDIDPIGGGTVKLTPDHRTPHSINPDIDPTDPDRWRALCARHQVIKKNFWDDSTGLLNVYAIVQAASEDEKREVYDFLKRYFGDE